MSYIDSHLRWMDRQKDYGWPEWVDQDAREWLRGKVREVMLRQGATRPLGLRSVYDHAWGYQPTSEVPECLRGAKLWDALLGITHRALLDVKAEERWSLPPYDWRRRMVERHDDEALSRIIEARRLPSNRDERWQPVGHDDGLCYDNGAFVVRLHAESGRWRVYQAGKALSDARGRARSWSKPSAACKAGIKALCDGWVAEARGAA